MWTRTSICRGRENLRLTETVHHVAMDPRAPIPWTGWETRGIRVTGGGSAPTTNSRAATRFCREGRTPGLDIMFRLLLTLTASITMLTLAGIWIAKMSCSQLFLEMFGRR